MLLNMCLYGVDIQASDRTEDMTHIYVTRVVRVCRKHIRYCGISVSVS